MDPKRDGSWNMLAKGRNTGEGSGYSFPSAGSGRPGSSFPPVDQHIVEPEAAGDELIRGRAVVALPAHAPHADRQADLAALMKFSIRPGYISSVELLTRVSEGSDFATDLSIRKAGDDPATGQRYLEELSFEIVHSQSMRDIREKAEDLVTRGVRRVFAIFVKKKEIGEWSQEARDFVKLDLDNVLEDPCLVRPVLLRALLDEKVAECEAVKALEEKKNPQLEALKEHAKQEGREEGLRRGVEHILVSRFGELSAPQKARLASANGELMSLWLDRLFLVDTIDALFGG